MQKTVEDLLVSHCGPVLFGKKPAVLFTVSNNDLPHAARAVAALHSRMRIKVMLRRKNSSTVFVYRPELLKTAVLDGKTRRMLERYGYCDCGELDGFLKRLRLRFSESGGFPHEIGFFLGYPAEDVIGFITHKGQNFKCAGRWKVYGDETRAKQMFREFDQCKQWLARHVQNGGRLCEAEFVELGVLIPITN